MESIKLLAKKKIKSKNLKIQILLKIHASETLHSVIAHLISLQSKVKLVEKTFESLKSLLTMTKKDDLKLQ